MSARVADIRVGFMIRAGRFLDRSLQRVGLRRADVEAASRAQDADGAGDVAEAGLSPGGSIVVWLLGSPHTVRCCRVTRSRRAQAPARHEHDLPR
jgi:hypothetical protein